jgi:hypothetical protein
MRLGKLSFLGQQSFGHGPAAKCARGNTRAGVVGDLFETAHQEIAPTRQAGAYIRSCEVSGIVERAHGDLARKPKGWLEYEPGHAAETREASVVPAARRHPNVPQAFCEATGMVGPSATATLKLFQERGEMFRDGVVDRIVPGSEPFPDFPQPRASPQDVATVGSARPTLLVIAGSCGSRRALTCAQRLSTKRPFLLRTSVKLQGISRHGGLVLTIIFTGWTFSGSSPSASARYISANFRDRRLSRGDFVRMLRRAYSFALPR